MGSAQKVASGVVWSVVVNVVNALYGFIATPLLIRYFGRSEYGIIALATSVNAYMHILDMGLSSTNVRFFSNWLAKGDRDKVVKLMQTCNAFYGSIGIFNAIVLIILSIFSDNIFNVTVEQNNILQQMLWILSITAVINWYTSCFGQLINATENVAWMQRRTLLTKFLMIGAVVATFVLKLTIVQYFFLTLLAGLSLIPLTIKKIRKETPYVKFNPKLDKVVFKEILPYSLNIFSFGIFQFTFLNLRTIILGMRGSIEAITDYGVINGLVSLVAMVGSVFIGALLPVSSRIIANKDKGTYYKIAYQGTHFITIILVFCSFGLMAINEDLMMVYVGPSFMHMIPWLNLWLVLQIYTHNSCISCLILGGSDIKLLTISCGASAASGILVAWFLVPYYQAGGTVLSLAAFYLVQLLFNYFYYWPVKLKINSWRIFIKTLVPILTIGFLCYILIKQIPHFENHWVNIFVFGIIFTMLYVLAILLILKKEDKDYIYNLLKSLRHK